MTAGRGGDNTTSADDATADDATTDDAPAAKMRTAANKTKVETLTRTAVGRVG